MLGGFEPRSPEAVQALVRALTEEKDDGARLTAAYSLGGSAAKTALPDLRRALKEDRSGSVREAAANVLAGVVKEATPDLLRALKEDKEAHVRQAAARVLAGVVKEATPDLLAAAQRRIRTPTCGEAAAKALRGATPDPTLLAALRAASADGQPWYLRVEAAMTVALLVPDDKESVGVLVAAFANQDYPG